MTEVSVEPMGPGKTKGFWSNGAFWQFDYDELGTIVSAHEVEKEEE